MSGYLESQLSKMANQNQITADSANWSNSRVQLVFWLCYVIHSETSFELNVSNSVTIFLSTFIGLLCFLSASSTWSSFHKWNNWFGFWNILTWASFLPPPPPPFHVADIKHEHMGTEWHSNRRIKLDKQPLHRLTLSKSVVYGLWFFIFKS